MVDFEYLLAFGAYEVVVVFVAEGVFVGDLDVLAAGFVNEQGADDAAFYEDGDVAVDCRPVDLQPPFGEAAGNILHGEVRFNIQRRIEDFLPFSAEAEAVLPQIGQKCFFSAFFHSPPYCDIIAL